MSTGRILTLDEVRQRGDSRGAIITGGHIVLTKKPDGFWHAPGYFDKDRVLSDPPSLVTLAYDIAKRFAQDGVQAVIGPTYGAVGLAAAVAFQLYLQYDIIVNAWGWAEEAQEEKEYCPVIRLTPDHATHGAIEKLSLPVKGQRVVKRCFPEFIRGAKTLVVEDVTISGGSAMATIEASRQAGANVFGLAVICDRSGLTTDALGVDKLEVMFDIPMEKFPENDCPLCAQGVPINMQVGHGPAFFQRRSDSLVPKGPSA